MRHIVLLLIVSTSLVLGMNDVQTQGNIQNSQGWQDTYLGKVIMKFTQLKSKAQQFDFSRLFQALDELEAGLKENTNIEQASFQKDQVQYATDVDFYDNQITQFSNEAATHKIDIQDLSESRQSLEETLSSKQVELQEVAKLQASTESTMAKNQKIFEKQISEYNDAITALDQALELVGSVRNGAFIELPKVEIIAEKLGKHMGNLNHRRVMYKPLVTTLVQLAQDSFADSEALSKILRLLQDLRDSLNASRTSLTNSYESERSDNQGILDQLVERTNNLNNTTIPQLQQDIQGNVAELQTKNQLLSDANSNLKASQDNFTATENRWIQRQKTNSDLISEYNNELSIIAQASTHLERSGIRRT